MTARTLIIGDVHGCLDELDALLAELSPSRDDLLCFIGDLVDRGPESVGTVRRVRELLRAHPGSVCLAGNHEAKVLRRRGKKGTLPAWTTQASDEDWRFLEGLPLLHRLLDHGALLVHGGIYPAFFADEGDPEPVPPDWLTSKEKRAERLRRFLILRHVDLRGHLVALGSETAETRHWSAVYDGRLGFIFFGHDPQLDPPVPLRAPHALGLDTGVCFGGRLTAAILEPGQAASEATFASVPGHRYAEPLKRA
jgi:3',5'-cyclic AMP phosphodiesterase CpdA